MTATKQIVKFGGGGGGGTGLDGMFNDDDLDAEADHVLNFVGGLDGDG